MPCTRHKSIGGFRGRTADLANGRAVCTVGGMQAEDRTGVVVLHDDASGHWLRFSAPRDIVTTSCLAEVPTALRRVDAAVRAGGQWAAGFVAYEAAPAFDPALVVKPDAGFPLLWFGLYDPPEIVAPPTPAETEGAPVIDWQATVTDADYRAAVDLIKTHIHSGDTYQVNYTYRLRAPFAADAWAAFARLVAAQESPYAACVDTGDWVLASASPELFFTVEGPAISSKPMKGTAARGLTLQADRAQAAALKDSEKDRAENVMIVDMVRNDLGRVALPGSVHVPRLFEVERYPTVWQLTSTVAARTTAGLAELFGALFPPASITGAPKVETMRLIAALETAPRRIYTGTIGFVAPGPRMQFNVAIRTMAVDRRQGLAEYGVGSGIVWDSDPACEWAECRTKTCVLTVAMPEFSLLETLRWTPGEGFALLQRHLGRLTDSAEYFGICVDEAGVRAELERAAAAWTREPHRVRLRVSRTGAAVVEAAPLPAPSAAKPRVAVARVPVDSADRFLYHKTTCRRVYEQARAAHPGADDVLLVNARGEITESTMANLAVEIDGRLCTPPVRCGLLAGTLRAELLDRGELMERVITRADLRRGGRVCLLNSVRGLWDVEVVDG